MIGQLVVPCLGVELDRHRAKVAQDKMKDRLIVLMSA